MNNEILKLKDYITYLTTKLNNVKLTPTEKFLLKSHIDLITIKYDLICDYNNKIKSILDEILLKY